MESKSKNRNEIKWGTIVGYIEIIVSTLVAFIYTPFMLKKMGQSEYGLYSLVASVVSYLSVLDMGFGNAMVRYISKSQGKKEKETENKLNSLFLIVYTIIGAIALLIGFILYQNIDKLFGKSLSIEELKKAKIIMIILIATIAINFPLSIFTSYVTACEKFIFLKILTIIKDISIPVIMIPLLLCGFKSIAMTIVNNGFTIFVNIVTLIYCFKKLNMKFDFQIGDRERKLMKEILGYSFFMFLNIIVDAIYNNTDQVILGSVCGTIAVSVYAVGSKIIQLNQRFSTTISGLFLPNITKTLQEENGDEKVNEIFIKVSRIQIYIMMFILSGFWIIGKMFIYLWAGKEYIDAYYIVLIIITPAIIPLTQNVCLSIIQAKNKHQFRSVMYILIAILNILISIPLAKKYQGIGAAIGTAIGNLLGQILTMNIFYYKVIHIDIPTYWKNFFKFTLPIIIITTIGISINHYFLNIISWKALIIEGIIYTIVYWTYVYTYMNSYEKEQVKNIFNKISKKDK